MPDLPPDVPPDVPREIQRLADGLDAVPVTIGESGASTTRFEAGGVARLFLKTVSGQNAREGLAQEAERLRWLAGRIEVPQVVEFVRRDDAAWLLTAALPGHDATMEMGRRTPEEMVALLAAGMRRWHELPTDGCPFDHSPEADLLRARQNVKNRLVDEAGFEPEWLGRSARDLFAELEATLPLPSCSLVLTHGDFSFPNVIFDGGQISGYVDVGRAGVSDRYKDLAICARSVRRNMGAGYVETLYSEYGREPAEFQAPAEFPDPLRLAFFTLLDEFF